MIRNSLKQMIRTPPADSAVFPAAVFGGGYCDAGGGSAFYREAEI